MIISQLSRINAKDNIDWDKEYLTFIPVDDCTFIWDERANAGILYYSLDMGSTWTELETGESTPTIPARTKILWKGDLRPTIANDDTGGIGTFSATANYYGTFESDSDYNTEEDYVQIYKNVLYSPSNV